MKKKVEVRKNEKGATMLEYSLLAALIAIVCILAVTQLGRNASNTFSRSSSAILLD